jgi:hypothetical protein
MDEKGFRKSTCEPMPDPVRPNSGKETAILSTALTNSGAAPNLFDELMNQGRS